jgi:glycosyltransferase involved in cell wall biosynthesis
MLAPEAPAPAPAGRPPALLIVLPSLAAEGCPQLALQLAGHWRRQGWRLEVLCLDGGARDLEPEFAALGVPLHWAGLGAGWRRYPRLLALSFRLCRHLHPRAVLCFPLGWHALVAIGARLAGVARTCAHVGNAPPVWTGRAFVKFRLWVQLGRPFTHRLLCCSRAIRQATIRDFGVGPRETRTIHNACDLQRFTPAARARAPHRRQPPRLGMVARLEPHKDQPTLIRALALLRDQGVCVQLWLIGAGSQQVQLTALVQSLGLGSQVRLLGSRRDIPELLAQLDLFVFAARPDEGFGIALAEAMAAGVPVVASNVPACHEVLAGGRCGLLVEPASPPALAAGIQAVLADPEGARRRAAAARRRARRHFAIPAMARAYAEDLGLA